MVLGRQQCLSLKKKVLFFHAVYYRGYRVLSVFLFEFSDSIAQSSHFCNARINLKKSLFYASLQKAMNGNRMALKQPFLFFSYSFCSTGASIFTITGYNFHFIHFNKFCHLSEFNIIQYKSPHVIAESVCI